MNAETKMFFRKSHLLFLVCLISILLVVIKNLIFFLNAGFTEGTVVDRRCYTSRKGYTTCTNWVEYNHGEESETFTSVDNLKIYIGQKVTVIYDKDNLSKAFVLSFFGYWWSEALAVLFLFIILFGIVHATMDWNDWLVYSNGKFKRVKKDDEEFSG